MLEFIKFSLISSIITVISGIVMWYFSRFDFDYNEIYKEGLDLYKKGNYKIALSKFSLLISKFPDKYNACYNAGLCELNLKSYQKAKDYFNEVLKYKPDDYDTLYNLGYIEMLQENYQKAKDYFLPLLDIGHDEADLLFNIGYIEKINGNLASAKEYIYRATQISPEKKVYKKVYQDILEIKFNETSDMNIVQEILDLSLELLVVYPDDETVIYRAALAYAQLGDWENSVNYCERLYNKNPNSYKACNQYGLALFCKGEMQDAIDMYEHAIELAPDSPDTYINLVYAYDKVNDLESSVQLANNIIEKFPNTPASDMAKDYLKRKEDEQHR